MWIAYAFGSALFAGLTSILAKCGIKQTDSNVATALRTIVVLVMAWVVVFVTGKQDTVKNIPKRSGASWLCPASPPAHPGHHRFFLCGLS